MQRKPLRVTRSRTLILGAALGLLAAGAQAAPQSPAPSQAAFGKLTGVVLDPAGIPQMGASVRLISESAGTTRAAELLTNTRGLFASKALEPGFYTVRVTLAGFLPGIERHVHVAANLTTLVRVELESLFTSVDQLRRQSAPPTDADDWKWVLRSAAAMRPVLQWVEDEQLAAQETANGNPRARLELTTGSWRPGSISNGAALAGTAVAYSQKLRGMQRLLLAGQMSYEGALSGGVATVWLPAGSFEAGPHTSLVLRQARFGPDGMSFRGVRLEQGGILDLGDRVTLEYGGEYVLVNLNSAVSSVRPRAVLNARLNRAWKATIVLAAAPVGTHTESEAPEAGSALQAALGEFDAFPAVLWRSGRPVLEGGWHSELAAERRLGRRGSLQIAALHDDVRHAAVFGRGATDHPDFFQQSTSSGFIYDGGSSSSWGARAAVREKVGDIFEVSAVYSYAGALTPTGSLAADLRDGLETHYFNSLGGSVSTRVPRIGTDLSAGYKWVGGPVVSRLDSFGETLYQIDPYFSFRVRQPLPKFGPGRWEALAECENLFAQGYLTVASRDGSFVLVPAMRSFRGGFSLQF